MKPQVLHGGFELETLESKADWFRTLTMLERLEYLGGMYEFALLLNPRILEAREDREPSASVRVLRLPQG